MKGGGDAVRDQLPVGVDQRHVDRKVDTGPGHHLPLERIAVQVDDARQHEKVGCVDAERGSARRTADVDDLAVGDSEGGFDQLAADQRLAAFDCVYRSLFQCVVTVSWQDRFNIFSVVPAEAGTHTLRAAEGHSRLPHR